MKYNNWEILSKGIGIGSFDGYSPLVSAVLEARGIRGRAFKAYLQDSFLQSPELLDDIDAGVGRVHRAIEAGERVAIYGDYDVDGITSACLMASYLKSRNLTPEVYIPERLDEGYGLSVEALDSLYGQGVSLIITVDCGIAAAHEAEHAAKLGIDIVITDHHECHERLPRAVAVIDPKKSGDKYPFKDLAGVGVAFKFICALEGGDCGPRLLAQYGDLVALGTVADMMPLTGENRTMVCQGLRMMNTTARPGISALLTEAGLKAGALTAQTISFGLAPRLNAAGRMGSSVLALELLCQDDPARAAFLASQLGNLNRLRQSTENRIMEAAIKRLENSGYTAGPIVLESEGWHKGVIGIVAARLMRMYGEPVILISVEERTGKGSCRSIPGFNIFKALTTCEDILENFGGHELAAGLTVGADKIPELRERVWRFYSENPPDGSKNSLRIDFPVQNPELLDIDNVKSLDALEPFGIGNPAPVLCIGEAMLAKIIPLSGGKHVRIIADKWGREFDCVFFSISIDQVEMSEGDKIDIAFTPQINTFRGRSSIQLLLLDVRLSAEKQLDNRDNQSGETAPAGSDDCPDRSDFARLYRYLSGVKDGKLAGDRAYLMSQLASSIGCGSSGRYYSALKVMDELGLLTLTEKGDSISIVLCPNPQKVNLESSKILRRLRRGGSGVS